MPAKNGAEHYRATHIDEVVYQARCLSKKGWTYWQIALKLDVNPNTISDWCQYKTRPYLNIGDRE